MQKWLPKYYVGAGVKKASRIQTKLNDGKFVPGVYLLTLPANPDNILDLVPAMNLVSKHSYDRCPLIIGMASDKDEALELCRKLVMKVYKETGGFCIRDYVLNR